MMIKTVSLILGMTVALALAGCGALVTHNGDGGIVQTKYGALQGGKNDGIYTYFAVPYAKATQRFVPAEKIKPWNGVRNATTYGPISLQSSASGFPVPSGTMDNNCQNLNIWTPGIDGKKRAVMVWLHGGGFSSGSAQESPAYNGENLSRKGDMVVVSVNHRLNIMGHLDLSAYGEKYKYSANVGIQDIVDSLKWIRENIERFGGDPKNVTLFGESGGGAKILALMTSPYAKGLFHKGIVQSGATESMGVNFTTLKASRRLGELALSNLGITRDNVDAIQTVSYEKLVEETQTAMVKTAGEFGLYGALSGQVAMDWEPVVDGDFLPTNPVTSDSFTAAGKDISLLIGTNLNEWASMNLIMGPDRGKTFSEAQIEQRLLTTYGEKKDRVVDEFLKAYPSKSKLDALYFDTFIRLPTLKIMTHKADQKGAPVFAYVFSYESPLAVHTAEIPYVFNNVKAPSPIPINRERTEAEWNEAAQVADALSSAWISFARSGKPSAASLPAWKAYTRSDGATMVLDTENTLVYGHDRNLIKILAPEYMW
ncbi:MAG: carboxylesterase family protein [Desulfobacter postgatei]|uniref:carboxylesterase/lipase family protein n=1 Tax=Desulfobacter postgatei TaxID=2293 RepID=UPI0023F18340|nr:carboxylesterase family protein [Desulfobacter postgatei]MDD4274844.1 carboxylesterase family protein [Desulfobacter postgatei]